MYIYDNYKKRLINSKTDLHIFVHDIKKINCFKTKSLVFKILIRYEIIKDSQYLISILNILAVSLIWKTINSRYVKYIFNFFIRKLKQITFNYINIK